MNSKASTGIKGLDKHLLGGVPKNQFTILEGCSGIGKTIFGLQFLKEGLYTDERVLLVTSKETPVQIREIISSLDWDLAWAFEQNRFFILDIREYFRDIDGIESNNDIFINLLKEVGDIVRNYNINRIVVDPAFPEFISGNANIKTIYFNGFNDIIEKSGNDLTIIFINNDSKENGSIESNVIKMYFEKEGSSIKRILLPQKIMFTDYQVKDILFQIKTKDGIWIDE